MVCVFNGTCEVIRLKELNIYYQISLRWIICISMFALIGQHLNSPIFT